MAVVQWIRSLVFNVVMYVSMVIYGIVMAPLALLSKDWAVFACRSWCWFIVWAARWMVGLKTEIRGTPPTSEVMIAAKHQSFFDIIVIYGAIPRGKFIMKRELLYTPFVGQYAMRVGCVPVDRGKRGQAIKQLKEDVAKGAADPGQLVIYPQGTRVAPDDYKPYKSGTGILYNQLGQPCVPVATNIGHFWPKRGVTRKPGIAVVEFLEAIEPGLEIPVFMKKLEAEIEGRSAELLRDARMQK